VILASLDGGVFNDQISREVQELIADMSNHAMAFGGSAKGKVSVNLDIALQNGVFHISADKKITKPAEPKSKSVMWCDANNNLIEQDPRQRKFDFNHGNVIRFPPQYKHPSPRRKKTMFDKDAIEALQKSQNPVVGRINQLTSDEEGKQIPFALVPEHMTLKSVKPLFDEYLEKPERRKGYSIANDDHAFIQIVNRFKAENSAVFRDAYITDTSIRASLRAILNYHPQSPEDTKADWCDHGVKYDFPLSESMEVWLEKNGQPFNQKEFSQFLEDNAPDMVIADQEHMVVDFGAVSPKFATPSEIMQLAHGIEIRSDEKITNVYKNSDGSFNMQFTTEHKDSAGQPLKLPEWFCIGIPVFENGLGYQFPVRLRFRKKEGTIIWFYELYRKKVVFTAAFDAVCNNVHLETQIPMFNGSPENSRNAD